MSLNKRKKHTPLQPDSLQNALFSWGDNSVGQLGTNNLVSTSSPVNVNTGTSWQTISVGSSHAAAIRSDGALFTWGRNNNGQLGLGDTIDRSNPTQVGSSLWTAVSAGGNHTLAIRIDGRLFAWGLNTSGQLGDGTLVSKSSPVGIGTSSWAFVSAGENHSFGGRWNSNDTTNIVRIDAWGQNNFGQLGLGDTITRSTPVAFGTTNWKEVVAGDFHSVGIRTDMTLSVWGRNDQGQLGLNDTINRSAPTTLGTKEWLNVSAGVSRTTAIDTERRLFAWGTNTGDGTTINRSSPVQIGTSSWTVTNTGNVTLAIDINNKLFSWGENSSGQGGDNTTVNKSSPVQVGTYNWKSISAARNNFSLGIRGDTDPEYPLKAEFEEGDSAVIPTAQAFNTALRFLTIYNPSKTKTIQLGATGGAQAFNRGQAGTLYGMPIRPPGFTPTNPTLLSVPAVGWRTFPSQEPVLLAPQERKKVVIGFNGGNTVTTGEDYFAVASRVIGSNIFRITRIRITASSVQGLGPSNNEYPMAGQATINNFNNLTLSSLPSGASNITPLSNSQSQIFTCVRLEGEGFQVQGGSCDEPTFGWSSGGYYDVFDESIVTSICSSIQVRVLSSSPGIKVGILRLGCSDPYFYIQFTADIS
jgi:alpha-tubulin suppressor-like RCC1 family protein